VGGAECFGALFAVGGAECFRAEVALAGGAVDVVPPVSVPPVSVPPTVGATMTGLEPLPWEALRDEACVGAGRAEAGSDGRAEVGTGDQAEGAYDGQPVGTEGAGPCVLALGEAVPSSALSPAFPEGLPD
jgi:hypothetical protein